MSRIYLGSHVPIIEVSSDSGLVSEGKRSIVVCQFEVPVVVVEDPIESMGARTLALRNGGCFGEGTTLSSTVNIRTTSDINGLNAAEACVQRSPI